MKNETLTPEAVTWLADLADEAQRELSNLPASSQPLWFRTEPEA